MAKRKAAKATAKTPTRSAAAGQASLAKARTAAGKSAAPSDLKRYAAEESNAQAELAQAGYSPEFMNQVSTFWQNIAKLPQTQQDKIMEQLKDQANATVDPGFDSEQKYLQTLRDAKMKIYADEFAQFKQAEEQGLKAATDEVNRGTASNLQGAFAGLSQRNAFDTGNLRSLADRAIEDQQRIVAKDTQDSQTAIASAQQKMDGAGNLLSIQSEQDLADLQNSRISARSQRLSSLLGLSASRELLAQEPTVNQITTPIPTTRAKVVAPTSLPSMQVGSSRTRITTATNPGTLQSRAAARGKTRSNLISTY